MLALTLAVSAVCFTGCARNEPSPAPSTHSEETPETGTNAPLKFNKNGSFKILHLTDFHEWLGIELDSGEVVVQDTLKPHLVAAIHEFLDREQPDLVVLGGDNVFSLKLVWDLFLDVSTNTYKAFAELMEEHNQYWTFTFGNHDSESAKSKYDFIKAVQDYPHFIGGLEDGEYYKSFTLKATEGESDYVGNYSVPIYSHNGDEVIYNVFILDSGSYDSPPASGVPYRYIRQEQVDFYSSEASRLQDENGKSVPSVMFTHIPLVEVAEAYKKGAYHTGVYTGTSASTTRSALYFQMARSGDVKGIFFGHQHTSSYTCVYENDGYSLVMGLTPMCQASSYDDNDTEMFARSVILYADDSLDTYIISNSPDYNSEATLIRAK